MAKQIYCETLGQSASYFLSCSTLNCWSRNLDYTEESVPMACRGAVHLWVCSSSYGRADRTHRKWPGAHCSVRKTLSDITISFKRSSAQQEAHRRGQLENNCICLRESSAFADVSSFVFQLATKEGYLVKQGAIMKARAGAAFFGEANHCAVLKSLFYF